MFNSFKAITAMLVAVLVCTSFSAISYAREYNETIEGSSVLTSRQMGDYVLLHNQNPLLIDTTIYQLADLYLSVGRLEGIRGDIAFAQAVLESGYFQYGGDVLPEQNNYAGIGTTGGGLKGAYFKNAEEGVRAQIQHLKAYGSTKPLVTELADPRFTLVTRGIAPKWTDLNGRWAVPGANYGQNILSVYDRIAEIILTIPNVELPSNHKLPVATLVPRQNVEMLAPNGTVYKTLQKNGFYRIYGVLGNNYDVGGGYLVKADSSKMNVFVGRLLIKGTTIPLYGPDQQVKRTLTKGETIRVYSYDENRFYVGGGYYIEKGSDRTYYLGVAAMKRDVTLFDKNGNPYKTLKTGSRNQVYKIDGNKLDLGGGYYVIYDKNAVVYTN